MQPPTITHTTDTTEPDGLTAIYREDIRAWLTEDMACKVLRWQDQGYSPQKIVQLLYQDYRHTGIQVRFNSEWAAALVAVAVATKCEEAAT